ncbi:MAG: hypothetical protein WAW37_00510 [Syntrophobacteraceae bacterium]
MQEEPRPLSLDLETSLPKWLAMRNRQIRTVLHTLFRLSCWTVVVWVVWNHALSNFFNFGRVGLLLSFGLGAFLHAMSTILEDPGP